VLIQVSEIDAAPNGARAEKCLSGGSPAHRALSSVQAIQWFAEKILKINA